jgi:hypothetical protein
MSTLPARVVVVVVPVISVVVVVDQPLVLTAMPVVVVGADPVILIPVQHQLQIVLVVASILGIQATRIATVPVAAVRAAPC